MDSAIFQYELEIPQQGNKIGLNLINDDGSNIECIVDTVPNSPSVHQLPYQSTNNFLIVEIYGEEPITAKGYLEEIKLHLSNEVKSKFNISLCKI